MKTRISFQFILILIYLFHIELFGQLSIGGEPLSFSVSCKDSIQTITMPIVNVDSLQSEDEKNQQGPFRFGYAMDVNIDIRNSGTWDTLSNGDKLWRIKIQSENAYSINLIFNKFKLQKGALLHVYNDDKTMILGGFGSFNNKSHGKFSTDLIKGDHVIIEYFEPATISDLELSINKVIHAYKDLFNNGELRDSHCNVDITCSLGDEWCIEKRAVSMVLLNDNTTFCSGVLLNNTSEDLSPYYLTSFNCLLGNDNQDLQTSVFRFQYWNTECNGNSAPSYFSTSGAWYQDGSHQTDYALLYLDIETIPSGAGIFFAGWNSSQITEGDPNIDEPIFPSESGAYIHHPLSNPMKISTYNAPVEKDENNWVVDLTTGTGIVQQGSQGAPLFNDKRKVIGNLRIPPNMNCFTTERISLSGRLNRSWDLGLSNRLDPLGTGEKVTEAISPPVYLINKKLTGTHRFAALNNLFIEGNVFVPVSLFPIFGSFCPENIAPFTAEPGSNVRFKSTKRVSIKKAHFKAGSKVHISTGQVTCEDNPVSGDRVSFCLANVSNMPQHESEMYASLNPEIYAEYSPTGTNDIKQSVQETHQKTSFKIHPNPSPGLFNINIQSKEQL